MTEQEQESRFMKIHKFSSLERDEVTNRLVIKLIDSYNGSTLQSFTGHLNSEQLPLEASFSPDSQFVISGSSDRRIHIWNLEL